MTHIPHPAPAQPRSFTPVPVRPRHDGWTPERQAGFIAALAACGCVGDAAARVGMSTDGAYELRQREGSVSFRAAWDGALDIAVKRLSEAAFSRALHGVVRPHYYKGELVGEHRVFNESLTRFLLQHLDPAGFAPLETEMTLYDREEEKVFALGEAVREMMAEAEANGTDAAEAAADEVAGRAAGAAASGADAADGADSPDAADAADEADEADEPASAAATGVTVPFRRQPESWTRPGDEAAYAGLTATVAAADAAELGHGASVPDRVETRACAGTETRACAADVSPALPVSGRHSDDWRSYARDEAPILPGFEEAAHAGAAAGRSDWVDTDSDRRGWPKIAART